MKKVLTLSLLITAGVFSNLAAEAVYPTFQLACYGRPGEGNIYRKMSDGSWQGKVKLDEWETVREAQKSPDPKETYCGLCRAFLKNHGSYDAFTGTADVFGFTGIAIDKNGEAIENQKPIEELCV